MFEHAQDCLDVFIKQSALVNFLDDDHKKFSVHNNAEEEELCSETQLTSPSNQGRSLEEH